MARRCSKTFFACVAFLAALGATAATRTWTGGGDGATWSDAANWGGVAPADGDTATFNVADTLICVAVGLLLLASFGNERLAGPRGAG